MSVRDVRVILNVNYIGTKWDISYLFLKRPFSVYFLILDQNVRKLILKSRNFVLLGVNLSLNLNHWLADYYMALVDRLATYLQKEMR